ncbi:hypothetical protein BB427_17075 [Pseudoalteromonas sp. BMB]|uniref:hypothetical protein n=1 Tax=Pseudoalteromonas sp. BMB TaxID=1874619 RepID=UPI00083E6482|nr:hypothetical protein [Pseudoalteromonas sp. BMB]ODB35678.1 hypothetical protein BB427_17075 [Pseudoalteromonas sp. BMB]
MNTIQKSLFAVLVSAPMFVHAAVIDTTASEGKFSFEGTIDPTCKTISTENNTTGLNLDASQTTQQIGVLEVWCNTGENATTSYSSANGGFLVSDNGQGSKLAYTLNIGDSEGIDLQNGVYQHTNATAAGTGSSGETKATPLNITPLSNGLNAAGTYSDVITVTVSSN